ncbi:MAG: SpoVA/SpoVAEb family sporulation membrane protein [Lachnospiraceae bacterium]
MGHQGNKNVSQETIDHYEKQIKAVTPTHSMWRMLLQAFVTGGLICTFGEWILNFAALRGLDKETAGAWCSMLLVLLSALLTGLNLYPSIAKFAGAGILVPITGFANSIASAALEFKREGQVFGVGAKVFTIAGPVILYGIFTSWVLGLFYWLGKMAGLW